MNTAGTILFAELRNTTADRRAQDLPDYRRRCEVAYINQLVPYDEDRWFAVSFWHDPYSKPASMLETSTLSGTTIQLHNGTVAGSPPFAIRRCNDDHIAFSTAGCNQTGQGTMHLKMPLTKNVWHDVVCRVRRHVSDGQWDVWLDATQVLSLTGIPTARTVQDDDEGIYLKHGPYHSGSLPAGGMGSDPLATIKARYANPVPPQIGSLIDRVSSPPSMPTF